jgi:broad specificity phosphatase PhoE
MHETKHPEIWLIRHGETEWSKSGQHTSKTDLPLTPEGEKRALTLGQTVSKHAFGLVLASPMKRAQDTARLVGFTPVITDDLREWDYGKYEGLTSKQIHQEVPGWTIWNGAVPGGETGEQVAARADRAIARAVAANTDVAFFAHGHILRVVAARWLGLPAEAGKYFALSTATMSILGYEHEQRVFQVWNDSPH